MFSLEVLSELFRHMEWADSKVWSTIASRGIARDDRLQHLLVHIHVVQQSFLDVWTSRPLDSAHLTGAHFSDLAAVRTWARSYYPKVTDFLAAVTAERLSAPLSPPWMAQVEQALGVPPGMTTLGDTCFQVASHSTYHRGQVNARIRELGVEPPLVDFIAWRWFKNPPPAWD
jgi:uncharacterized damage-inducible protein DinB